MGEKSKTFHTVECDWCGLEKEGRVEKNDFAIIEIRDADYYAKLRESKSYLSFMERRNEVVLCPSCYEPVKVFLKQKEEERKVLRTQNV